MNLVLQGRALPHAELKRIVQMVSGGGITALGPGAVRISGAEESPLVATYCEENELDFAWVPATRLLSNLRLLAMDMDSTLVTIESIDEMGGLLGIKDRIAAIPRCAAASRCSRGSKSPPWSASVRSGCSSRRAPRR